MPRIAHLKVICPSCGEWTNIYVEETGAASAQVKCEHCGQEFTFGAGMMYDPIGYVAAIPPSARLDQASAKKSSRGAKETLGQLSLAGKCFKCQRPTENSYTCYSGLAKTSSNELREFMCTRCARRAEAIQLSLVAIAFVAFVVMMAVSGAMGNQTAFGPQFYIFILVALGVGWWASRVVSSIRRDKPMS
ncbi:MAG: hypothetical protein FWG16_07690, partial [Micrococcales bacterium]|nr:hypothetical protein [Micrococcales bacterium]